MIENLIYYSSIILLLFLAIIAHEFGHLIACFYFGIKVKTFSIGRGKPIFKFKFNNTMFQLTPWLIGGYCDILGERQFIKNGFLSSPYYCKALILLSGVIVNLLLALISFQIYYGNIIVGLQNALTFLNNSLFTSGFDYGLFNPVHDYSPLHFNILFFGLLNFICFIINLLPIPSSDGSLLIIYKLPHKIKMEILNTFTEKWFSVFNYSWQILLVIIINWR
jgi:hypothetical protein